MRSLLRFRQPSWIGSALILVTLAFASLSSRGLADDALCEPGPPYAEGLVEGSPRVVLELAESPDERAQGLMFRESMPEDAGMLFIFPARTEGAFWMGNTLIPLSIAFILEDGTILDIQDMGPLGILAEQNPPPPIKYYAPSGPYLYALETNQGWFAAKNVRAGDRLLLCLGR